MHERETETVECRDCGAPFNLAAQYYYDNLCPQCKRDQDGEKTTWPACTRCGTKVDPNEAERIKVRNRGVPSGSERVIMHPDCAEEYAEMNNGEPW